MIIYNPLKKLHLNPVLEMDYDYVFQEIALNRIAPVIPVISQASEKKLSRNRKGKKLKPLNK